MTIASDKTKVRAISQGINLSELKQFIPELEAACYSKMDSAERFKDVITVAAIKIGVLPGVLSQYIVARCTDSVKKKARSAEQLSLLFGENI